MFINKDAFWLQMDSSDPADIANYRPMVMICGLPGVGKTTYANELSELLSRRRDNIVGISYPTYKVVSIDACKDTSARERGIYYKTDYRALAESLFHMTIAKEYALGYGIIAEATFKLRMNRQALYSFAKNEGLEVLLLELFCSDEIACERIRNDEMRSRETRQKSKLEGGFVPSDRPSVRARLDEAWQPINNDDYQNRKKKNFNYKDMVHHVRFDSGENAFFYNYKKKKNDSFDTFVDDIRACLDHIYKKWNPSK